MKTGAMRRSRDLEGFVPRSDHGIGGPLPLIADLIVGGRVVSAASARSAG